MKSSILLNLDFQTIETIFFFITLVPFHHSRAVYVMFCFLFSWVFFFKFYLIFYLVMVILTFSPSVFAKRIKSLTSYP